MLCLANGSEAATEEHHLLGDCEAGFRIAELGEERDGDFGPAGHSAGGALTEMVDAKLRDAALHSGEEAVTLPGVELERSCR